MQAQHVHVDDVGEPSGDTGDLRRSGQEGEQVTRLLPQCPAHGVRDVVEGRGIDAQAVRRGHRSGRRAPADLDRVRDAGRRDDGRGRALLTERPGDRRGVHGRRGGEQAEVLTQARPRVDGEGEGQVGVQMALVALVEDDGADARQLRVPLQPLHQHPGRDHLDDGGRRDPALAAHGEPDPSADGFPEQVGHPAGGRPRSHPAGLGDDDPPPGTGAVVRAREQIRARGDAGAREHVRQDQRDQRRLPAARWGDQDRAPGPVQGGEEVGNAVPDREVRQGVRVRRPVPAGRRVHPRDGGAVDSRAISSGSTTTCRCSCPGSASLRRSWAAVCPIRWTGCRTVVRLGATRRARKRSS